MRSRPLRGCVPLLAVLLGVLIAVVSAVAAADPATSASTESAASSSQPPPTENERMLIQFSDWLQKHGVRVNKLGVGALNAAGRGVVATDDIKEGDVLIAVPPKVAMTSAIAREKLGQYVEANKLSDMEMLALLLLHESFQPDSEWRAYISLLPRAFNLPYYWNEADLEQLRGSIAYDLTMARRQRITEFYTNVIVPLTQKHPDVFPPARYTLDEVAWAVSVVLTRSYGLQTATGTVSVLVPMLDMLNHANVRTRFGVTEDGGVFHIIARDVVARGQEVFASFGNKTNAELLSTYGFILRNNEHDGVSVRVALDPHDSFRAVRAAMLHDLQLPTEAVFALTRAVPVPADLVVMLRVHFLQPSELDRYRTALDGPVSLENELRVYRRLLTLLQSALNAYPTRLEDDEALLRAGTPSTNAQLAVAVRAGEKTVLQAAIRTVTEAWMEFLRAPEPAAEPHPSAQPAATGA